MRPHPIPRAPLRRCSLAIVCAIAAAVVGLAPSFAEDAPTLASAPPAPAGQTPPILAPSWSEDWLPLSPAGQLFIRTLPPVSPDDKGSVYTDASDPASPAAAPNALEQEKLAMARQAVEASRAAGTLWVTPLGGSQSTPPADAEAVKLEQLRAMPSLPLQPDPAAAVGETPPLQVLGTSGMAEQERAKLEKSRSAQDGKEGTQP
jgi:hypothetical protein